MTEKVLRGNIRILAAYPEAFADFSAPTSAELNDVFVFTSNEDGKVFDISCAVLDEYTLGMTDPDTDDSISICDIATVETPTFDNYEASLDLFRDASVTAAGVFNMARELFMAPDRPFVLVKRIDPPQSDAFAAGQVVSLFGVNTDIPVDLVEDNANIQFGARFKPTGSLNVNYTLLS